MTLTVDLNPFNIPTPESCCPVQTFNENSHTGSDLISARTNLQDLMLLLQVVFPLSQPGQRLPRLLQAVLPAPQLHVCKGDQVKINWHLALQNVVCGDVNGS